MQEENPLGKYGKNVGNSIKWAFPTLNKYGCVLEYTYALNLNENNGEVD